MFNMLVSLPKLYQYINTTTAENRMQLIFAEFFFLQKVLWYLKLEVKYQNKTFLFSWFHLAFLSSIERLSWGPVVLSSYAGVQFMQLCSPHKQT